METIKSTDNFITIGDGIRDINPENGRCDLLPLREMSPVFLGNQPVTDILCHLGDYVYDGKTSHLNKVLTLFYGVENYPDPEDGFKVSATCLLELSVHYKAALDKYPPRNWEKGLLSHSYLDSAVRHLLKWMRRDDDEEHNRAFAWNILGLIWNHNHRPDLIDLPFNQLTGQKLSDNTYSTSSKCTSYF